MQRKITLGSRRKYTIWTETLEFTNSFFYCFLQTLKIRFQNNVYYAKGNEMYMFQENFFTWVTGLDHLNCPRASEFPQNCSPSCLNHSGFFSWHHCAREKSNFFRHWLTQCQQNVFVYSLPNTGKTDNFFLTLSLSLTISVSKTNQVKIKNVPENVTFEVVEEGYRQIGLHKLLRKVVFLSADAEFLQFMSNTDSIDSFLNFMGNHVKYLIEAADVGQQHQSSEISSTPETYISSCLGDPRLPKRTFNEVKDWDVIVDILVFQYRPWNIKQPCRASLKQSIDFFSLHLLLTKYVQLPWEISQAKTFKPEDWRVSKRLCRWH